MNVGAGGSEWSGEDGGVNEEDECNFFYYYYQILHNR